MNSEAKPTSLTSKITVQIWLPVLQRLNEKLDAACLRRDAYLAKVLAREVEALDEEVSIQNSEDARELVVQRLEQLTRKAVTLTLPQEVISRANAVCQRKRIVRDAFFNRLFFLLASPPQAIDALFFGSDSEWRTDVWSEYKSEGPFFQNIFYPLEPDIDPLWAIRAGLELRLEGTESEERVDPTSGRAVRVQRSISGEVQPLESVYTTLFERKVGNTDLLGLNCYVPDWKIPGHPAEAVFRESLNDIVAELFGSRE